VEPGCNGLVLFDTTSLRERIKMGKREDFHKIKFNLPIWIIIGFLWAGNAIHCIKEKEESEQTDAY